ncbi:MAG TPA: ATP-binding protein, partial [Acidimicrobiales bacterium]|nr:ATP-binding protein [Acidimicrobiales bacterium]
GVPDEDRESIFYRFNRGSLAGRRLDVDGVGLGLALVAEHVRLHGGSVWVEDRADGEKGSRFVIELPTEAP